MTNIAEFSVPPEALPGGSVLVDEPGLRFELDRVVPTDSAALPFCWVDGSDVDWVIEQIRAEPEIDDLSVLSRVEGKALVRATWTPDATLVHGMRDCPATILNGAGTAEGWTFRVRGPDRDDLISFQELFKRHDVPVTLERIYDLEALLRGDHYTLTPEQQETLVAAYHGGYFEKPRSVTQEDLGEEFGVTARAVSDRLRRGMRNLVGETLLSADGGFDS